MIKRELTTRSKERTDSRLSSNPCMWVMQVPTHPFYKHIKTNQSTTHREITNEIYFYEIQNEEIKAN